MQRIKRYCNIISLASIFTLPLSASWAEETLSNMNLRQKIGQLFIARTISNFNQPTPFLRQLFEEMGHTARHEHIIQLIKEYHIGGIIFLLDSDIKKHVESTNKFQSESTLPLLNCLDLTVIGLFR